MRNEGGRYRCVCPYGGVRWYGFRANFRASRRPGCNAHSIEESVVHFIVKGLVGSGDAFECVATMSSDVQQA
eukprot:5174237-Pleurochrysis_carterae.AAC.4